MAPSRYEEVELLGADTDAQRSCKTGRIVGIVVAMLAVLGLVGAASLPQKKFSAKQHLAVVHKALLKAFSPRSLAEAAQLKSSVAFSMHQDGVPLDPQMTIKATVSTDEDPPEHQQLEVDIGAEADKGEDLKKALLKLAAAVQSEMQSNMQSEMPADEVPADEAGDEEGGRRLQENEMPFKVDVKDDLVTFIIPLPPPPGPAQDEMTESLQTKPTLSATLEFGRTLEEMCKNIGDKVPMVFNGVKVQMDASFAATMAKAAGTMEHEYGSPAMGDEVDMLEAFSELSTDVNLVYRDPSKLEKKIANMFPPFARGVGMVTQYVQHMGDDVQTAVKDLDGLSAGTKRIALRGLPEGYQFVVELSNFNLAPVLKQLIDGM